MTNRDFLIWIHERLVIVHGESPLIDYMHKLRAIITEIPKDQETYFIGQGGNDVRDLRERLEKIDKKNNRKKRY